MLQCSMPAPSSLIIILALLAALGLAASLVAHSRWRSRYHRARSGSRRRARDRVDAYRERESV